MEPTQQQLAQQSQDQQEQLQNLMSLLNGQDGSSPLGFLGDFQSLLQMFLIIGVLLSVAFMLFFVLHFIHKWRVESAILRIDKNLEKLVAAQVPVVAEEKSNSSDKEEKEQK